MMVPSIEPLEPVTEPPRSDHRAGPAIGGNRSGAAVDRLDEPVTSANCTNMPSLAPGVIDPLLMIEPPMVAWVPPTSR